MVFQDRKCQIFGLKTVNFGTEHVQFFLRNNNIYFKLITSTTAMVYLMRKHFLRLLRLLFIFLCTICCCTCFATYSALTLPASCLLMYCPNTLLLLKDLIKEDKSTLPHLCSTVLAHFLVCTECVAKNSKNEE